MIVERVDLDDDRAVAEWYGPMQTTPMRQANPKTPTREREFRVLMRHRAAWTSVLAVVRETAAGRAIGSAWVRLPLRENRQVAHLTLAVRPGDRRRGAGRALLDLAERVARDHGRSEVEVTTDGPADVPQESHSVRFARSAGYAPVLPEARRALRVPVAAEHLDALEATCLPAGAGYAVVTWTGGCPDRFVDGRVALARSISTDDGRQGSLEREAAGWDLPRLRDFEATVAAMDRVAHAAGAVASASGELVGFTEIGVPRAAPKDAYQHDTVVLSEHRGHRLGTRLKIANLRALAEDSPATERVHTWNAAANRTMIHINEALGFELTGVSMIWRKQLD